MKIEDLTLALWKVLVERGLNIDDVPKTYRDILLNEEHGGNDVANN